MDACPKNLGPFWGTLSNRGLEPSVINRSKEMRGPLGNRLKPPTEKLIRCTHVAAWKAIRGVLGLWGFRVLG